MHDAIGVQVVQAQEKLPHQVEDVVWPDDGGGVRQKARQIVVHVFKHHIDGLCKGLHAPKGRLTVDGEDLQQLDDALVAKLLQKLDLTKSRQRELRISTESKGALPLPAPSRDGGT